MKLFDFAIIIALSSAFTLTSEAEFFFKSTKHKFEDTNEGVVLEHDYEFQNIGGKPLIISNYQVSCPCTKVTFPQEPIAPGANGKIHLSFDTHGKYGLQNRKILLNSNAVKSPFELTFKVYVIPKD